MNEAGSLPMSGWDKEHVHGRRIIHGTCNYKVRVGGFRGSYEAALLTRLYSSRPEGHCQLFGPIELPTEDRDVPAVKPPGQSGRWCGHSTCRLVTPVRLYQGFVREISFRLPCVMFRAIAFPAHQVLAAISHRAVPQ